MSNSDTKVEEIMMNVHVFMQCMEQCENIDKILTFESSEIGMKKTEDIENSDLFYTIYVTNSKGDIITVNIYSHGFVYTFDSFTSKLQKVLPKQVEEIYKLLKQWLYISSMNLKWT